MELLTKLGIDWRLFIAQLVNFLILLAVLYKFLYKPLLKLMHDREEKIERGLKQAEEMDARMRAIEALKEDTIAAARRDAEKIFSKARSDGETLRVSLTEKAKQDADRIITDGVAQLTLEKAIVLKDLRKELAVLVTSATKQVVGEVISKDVDAKLVERIVNTMEQG